LLVSIVVKTVLLVTDLNRILLSMLYTAVELLSQMLVVNLIVFVLHDLNGA
jgi:hypothetical protein